MKSPHHSEPAAWISHNVHHVLGPVLRFLEGEVLLSVDQLNAHLDALTRLFDSSDVKSKTLTGSHDDAGAVLEVLERLRGDPSMSRLIHVPNRVPMQSFIQAQQAASVVYVQKAPSVDLATHEMLDWQRWIWYTSDDHGKRTALLCARALADYYHHRPDEFMALSDMVVATLNARAEVPRHSKESLNRLLDDLITLWRDLLDKHKHRQDDLWCLHNAFAFRFTQIIALMRQFSMQAVNQNAITSFIELVRSIPLGNRPGEPGHDRRLNHAAELARAERLLSRWYHEALPEREKDILRLARGSLRPFLLGTDPRKRRRRLDPETVHVELHTDRPPRAARPVDVNPDVITDVKLAADDTARRWAASGARVQLAITHARLAAGSGLVSASVLRVCRERDGLRAGELGIVTRLDRSWCDQCDWDRVVKSLPEVPA